MKIDWFSIAGFVIGLAVVAAICFGTSGLVVWLRDRKRMDVYGLRPGQRFQVVRAFQDHYGNAFEAGEQLTFKSRDYLPYHGGHTVVFEEKTMYLQDEDNAAILGNLAAYLRPV